MPCCVLDCRSKCPEHNTKNFLLDARMNGISKPKRKQSKTNRIKHNSTVIVETKKEEGYSDKYYFFNQNDDEQCARKCMGVAAAVGRDQARLFFVNNTVQPLLKSSMGWCIVVFNGKKKQFWATKKKRYNR